jgi:hypothetical protein
VTQAPRFLGEVWAEAFAKPSKLWRPARNWKLHEWTLLNVAFGRIKDSVESYDIAIFDLHQHFVTGRMKSALRHLFYGKESRLLLQPEFWPQLQFRRGLKSGAVYVDGHIEGQPLAGGAWAFFVRTTDLDKHYPPAVRRPDPVQPPPQPDLAQPPPRRRGPATTHDWFRICGEIAHRCVDPKTGRVRVPKSERKLATAVLQWLSDRDIGQPAESEMREAVKQVCAALRAVQK